MVLYQGKRIEPKILQMQELQLSPQYSIPHVNTCVWLENGEQEKVLASGLLPFYINSRKVKMGKHTIGSESIKTAELIN